MDRSSAVARVVRLMSEVNLDFRVLVDNAAEFEKALKELVANSVYAGYPDDGQEREDEDGNPTPITNAALAYIHDKGAPEAGIPARPFMIQGIESKKDQIADGLEQAGIAALDGDVQ